MPSLDHFLSTMPAEQATALVVVTPILVVVVAILVGFTVQHAIAVRMLSRIGGRL